MNTHTKKYVFPRPIDVPWLEEPLNDIDLAHKPYNTDIMILGQVYLAILERNGKRAVFVPLLLCIGYGEHSDIGLYKPNGPM